MRKTALVIYKPVPNQAVSPEMWLGDVVHKLATEGGYQVKVFATGPDMSFKDITAEDFAGCDLVIAAGGDGTIRLVLGALAHWKCAIPVGLLPLGTGNQLARNLSIYEEHLLSDPLEQALNVILHGEPRAIDLGIMNGEYFAVAAGAGPFSDAVIHPDSQEKAAWKMLAYASAMVQSFALPPVVFTVVADNETFRVAASGIFVTNIADLGVGTLSESAELDDGLLDLCILDPREFTDYMELGFRFAGGFVGGKAPYYIRKVKELMLDVQPVRSRMSQFQKFGHKMRAAFRGVQPEPVPIQQTITAMIDGDPCGHTPMNITVAPRAVQVLAPKPRIS